MISKIVLDKKSTLAVSVLVLVVVLGVIIFLASHHSSQKFPSTETVATDMDAPTIYVPTESTSIAMPMIMGTNQAYPAKIDMPWPRTFVIISNSITSKKKNSSDGKIYNYGDKVSMNQNREILEDAKPSGNFIASNVGLILDSFYPSYAKVFPVTVDSYKKLPIEVKYLLLEKSGIFCSFQVFGDTASTASILTGNIPESFGYMNDFLSNINSCQPNFSMPKSSFVAEHAVAYADLDNDLKTPDHILIIADNSQYGTGSDCTSNPMIVSIDANNKYYLRDLSNNGPTCYIDTIPKGTTVQITKITPSSNGGGDSIKTKENFVMPSDSFIVHGMNDQVSYVLYDKTTSTQVKTIQAEQYIYANGGYEGGY